MEKFRTGDVVAIEATIASDHEIDGKLKVRIEPWHDIFVDRNSVTMKRSQFRVGDLVENDGARGIVLAVYGEYLWIGDASFSPESWPMEDSRRVLPEPIAKEPTEEAPPAPDEPEVVF